MICPLSVGRGECSRKCEHYYNCQESESCFIGEVCGSAMYLPFNSDFEESLDWSVKK